MKNPGLGIQRFSKFKEKNLIYVDKTEIIHKLITGGDYYFLSRPRRFGKSLLLDTIGEIFSGSRELFEDCWIYDQWNWEERHPVIKISFIDMAYKEEGLRKSLENYLDELAVEHGVSYRSDNYSGKFLELIKKTGAEKPAVILIDEYDKPIVDYLENDKLEQAEENREILRSLYQGVKGLDGYIRLLLITGVSKFSKVSIFSDLNHLRDITLSKDYAAIVGYTEEEIRANYPAQLTALAEELDCGEEELFLDIREWYEGYSWDGKTFLHNPFSILNMLLERDFDNYWFETGTPTFLLKSLKERDENLNASVSAKVKRSVFNKYDIDRIDGTALMFQAGYLTVKSYDRRNQRYVLDFPNREVRDSFLEFFLARFADRKGQELETINDMLIESLRTKDLESFFLHFRSLFSSIAVKQLDKVKRSTRGFIIRSFSWF